MSLMVSSFFFGALFSSILIHIVFPTEVIYAEELNHDIKDQGISALNSLTKMQNIVISVMVGLSLLLFRKHPPSFASYASKAKIDNFRRTFR